MASSVGICETEARPWRNFTGTDADEKITPAFVASTVTRDPAGLFPSDAADTLDGAGGADTLDGDSDNLIGATARTGWTAAAAATS